MTIYLKTARRKSLEQAEEAWCHYNIAMKAEQPLVAFFYFVQWSEFCEQVLEQVETDHERNP
jgi:hypothetical protein